MIRTSPLFWRGLAIAVAVIVADQFTKWLILEVMDPPRIITVTGFFNIVLAWNRGVSFSLFETGSAAGPWILSILALAISAGLLVWMTRQRRFVPTLALGLVIGGAIGNVVDRFRFGAVVDFLDVHGAGYHWPAFNVADSAITVGVALLIIDGLFARADGPKMVPAGDGARAMREKPDGRKS
jgi:signal peptidase II